MGGGGAWREPLKQRSESCYGNMLSAQKNHLHTPNLYTVHLELGYLYVKFLNCMSFISSFGLRFKSNITQTDSNSVLNLTSSPPSPSLSQGEDGAESGDDNEEEDGFFVPHGYLSDSEGDHSGDEGTRGQDDQVGVGN